MIHGCGVGVCQSKYRKHFLFQAQGGFGWICLIYDFRNTYFVPVKGIILYFILCSFDISLAGWEHFVFVHFVPIFEDILSIIFLILVDLSTFFFTLSLL